jgi:long-chain acyl-CoA synthetase
MTDGLPEPDWPRPWAKVHERLGVAVPPFDDRPIGAHVERHAEARPDAPALFFGGRTISYAELDRMAGALAAGLKARGVGRGDVVGLHLPNLPQYAAGVVAVSKLGAVGSGVSPLLAPPELGHQLADSRAKAVITLDALAPALAKMDAPESLELVVVTTPTDAFAPGAPDLPEVGSAAIASNGEVIAELVDPVRQVETRPEDTAFIQYTGGTTGRPKGAMLSIRTLMHNPRAFNAASPYREYEEVVATAFPMFHIAGLSVFTASMIYGAQVFLVPNPRDTKGFAEMMRARPPTLMSAVPALYDMLLAEPAFRDADFSRLRIAASGAAPLPASTIRKLNDTIGEGRIADAFGMTETGPCYTFHPPSVRKEGTIGLPMPGAEVRIVDVETGTKLMPFGEPGEIACAGPQVMQGYLGLPEESERALREHAGRRWMFSGDVGSMDEEGYITLRDRAKDMLIVGGYKVFSVEVEDQVKGRRGVEACALVGTPDEDRPGNDVVHLFLALNEEGRARGRAPVSDEVVTFIRETMAPYKVPRHVHVVDAIPLTPVGKIDKKALRVWAGGG